MASNNPLLKPEIGPDGLAREASVIGYTERVLFLSNLSLIFFCSSIYHYLIFLLILLQIIEEEQLQLHK
jgi:hypothetical protein